MFFFFNDTATTEIYTLSLHDALPIYAQAVPHLQRSVDGGSARPSREVGSEGNPTVPRRRLSRLCHDRIPRPLLDRRGADGHGRGGAAHRGGRDRGAHRGRRAPRRNEGPV